MKKAPEEDQKVQQLKHCEYSTVCNVEIIIMPQLRNIDIFQQFEISPFFLNCFQKFYEMNESFKFSFHRAIKLK